MNGLAVVGIIVGAMAEAAERTRQEQDQYVRAPYLLGDEGGSFMLQTQTEGLFFKKTRYLKTYVEGRQGGAEVEIKANEFKALSEEAEAVWGKEDKATGRFVPGLLLPKLPVMTRGPIS